MSAPHFVIVRTDDGTHLRITGGNGEIVLNSEVYDDERTAEEAIECVEAAVAAGSITHYVDERPIDTGAQS